VKLDAIQEKFILHWGEMGTRWGINRTVAQIHALLYIYPRPLSAEEIAETLNVARSNVSNSLRELQGWRIVKLVHVMGDKRDHFESMKDVWEMFRIVLDERKRREIDPTMTLLDKAVRRVAVLDEPHEMNYVRRNISEGMQQAASGFDDAATRVFSNAPGNYGTNVNFMVMDSQWETAETLGDLFVTRKCFAYSRDSQGRTVEGREARHLMDDALSRVEATYQNLDSFEIGLTDVDHYFEYLGGVSKAVELRTNARPAIYVCDSLSPQTRVRSLEETVRLETRSKTLNPKWYEGMLKHGFRGVAEIENHVANTFGWSATADAVDPWIYTEISKTFVMDPIMFKRLLDLNPHSVHSLTKRLVEAHDRGYWNPEEEIVERLRDIVADLQVDMGAA